MNQTLMWIIGLALCVGATIGLYIGLRAEDNRTLIVGCASFMTLWYAGFFCFVAAS